jgi:ribA/ribD-fused uncharacterized protein
MDTIFFCSHHEKNYQIENWRCVFSQWYKCEFMGDYAIYNLDNDIDKEDFENLIKGKKFFLREQWMMSLKALVFANKKIKNMDQRDENLILFEKIINSKDPKKIKEYGREIKGFDELVWEKCRYQIVVNGNYLTFLQNESLKKILLGTGNREIVEAAAYDKIWGIGFNEKNAKQIDKKKWGLNLLGKAIMETRNILKNQINELSK